MMRRFLATLCLFAIACLPGLADATHRDAGYLRLVRWAGCEADVITSDRVHPLRSFYDGSALWIGTLPGAVPADVELMVLLHEVGHCLQYQEYGDDFPMSYMFDPVPWELDADRRSADLACGLGLDGRGMLHDFFVWTYRAYGYEGDENHGTIAERIGQGERAARCRVGPQEAA